MAIRINRDAAQQASASKKLTLVCEARRFIISPSLFHQAASWFKDKCNALKPRHYPTIRDTSTSTPDEDHILVIENCDAYTLQRVISYLQNGRYEIDDKATRLPESKPFPLLGFTPASFPLMSLLDGPASNPQAQSYAQPPSSQVITVPARPIQASPSDGDLISFEEDDELLNREIPKITTINKSFSEVPRAADVAAAWNVIRVYHTANGIGLTDLRDDTIGHLQGRLPGLTLAEGFIDLVRHTFRGFQLHVDIATPGPSSLILQQCADNIDVLLNNSGFVDTIRGDSHFAYLIIRSLAGNIVAAPDQAGRGSIGTSVLTPGAQTQGNAASPNSDDRPTSQSSNTTNTSVKALRQKLDLLQVGIRLSEARLKAPAVHPEILAREMARARATKTLVDVSNTQVLKKEPHSTRPEHENASAKPNSHLHADMEIGRLISKAEKLQKDLEKAVIERNQANTQLESLTSKVEQLQKTESEMVNVIAERDDYANEFKNLETTNKQMRQEIKRLEDETHSIVMQKEILNARIEELVHLSKDKGDRATAEVLKENERLHNAVKKQDQLLSSTKGQVMKLQMQNTSLPSRIERQSASPPPSPNVVTRGVAALQANVEKLESEIAQWKSRSSEQTKTIAELKSNNEKTRAENKDVLGTIHNLQAQMKARDEELATIREENTQGKLERTRLIDKVACLELEAENASKANDRHTPAVELTSEAAAPQHIVPRNTVFTPSPTSPAFDPSSSTVRAAPTSSQTASSHQPGSAATTSTSSTMSVWASGTGPLSFAARRMQALAAAQTPGQPTVAGAANVPSQGQSSIGNLTDSMNRLNLAGGGRRMNDASGSHQSYHAIPGASTNADSNHVQMAAATAPAPQSRTSTATPVISPPAQSRSVDVPLQPSNGTSAQSLTPALVQQPEVSVAQPTTITSTQSPANTAAIADWRVERERMTRLINFLQAQLTAFRMSEVGARSHNAPVMNGSSDAQNRLQNYNNALTTTALEIPCCVECNTGFHSQFRGATEDSGRFLILKCKKCGSENARWDVTEPCNHGRGGRR